MQPENKDVHLDKIYLDKIYLEVAKEITAIHKYGDTIQKEWLIQKFRLKKPEFGTEIDFQNFAFEYLQCIEALKDTLLEENQMHLRSIRGVGYIITMPGQQSDIAMSTMRTKIRSEIVKASRTICHTNITLLTDEETRRRDSNLGKLAAAAAFSRVKLHSS
jgi:hypothetical protein